MATLMGGGGGLRQSAGLRTSYVQLRPSTGLRTGAPQNMSRLGKKARKMQKMGSPVSTTLSPQTWTYYHSKGY